MKKKEFYLDIVGKRVKVTEEVYQVCCHGKDKEDYFMKKLKKSHTKLNVDTQEMQFIPSRELSYEQLAEKTGSLYRRITLWRIKLLRRLCWRSCRMFYIAFLMTRWHWWKNFSIWKKRNVRQQNRLLFRKTLSTIEKLRFWRN